MEINKVEAIGIALSIAAMATALWLLRFDTATDVAATPAQDQAAAIVVAGEGDQDAALANAIVSGSTASGRLEKVVIDDIVVGDGPTVEKGDKVTVDYIGTLRNGQQFDNTYTKGSQFTFTVGEGKVIPGWEMGITGMRVGGQRVIVVPPEYAYGKAGSGPIPGGATLVFAIELLAIE